MYYYIRLAGLLLSGSLLTLLYKRLSQRCLLLCTEAIFRNKFHAEAVARQFPSEIPSEVLVLAICYYSLS